MRSLNRVELIGHLGADPETRYTPSGDAVTNLRLATNEAWTDRASGERRERTEWHRCVLWRKLAEIAEQYLRKGSRVFVAGQLTTRQWQDQTGNERYTTEIQVRDLLMLDAAGASSRPEHTTTGVHPAYSAQQGGPTPAPQPQQQQTGHVQPQPQPQQAAHYQAQAPGPQPDFDDDIPF